MTPTQEALRNAQGAAVDPSPPRREEDLTWELANALRAFHDEMEDYSFINDLGGYNNHNMRRARMILLKAGFQFAADRAALRSASAVKRSESTP